jgi:hypothetical protein
MSPTQRPELEAGVFGSGEIIQHNSHSEYSSVLVHKWDGKAVNLQLIERGWEIPYYTLHVVI